MNSQLEWSAIFVWNRWNLVACCTGHRKNKYFEKISLAPKLCEMYATILLKLFLNFHQHIIEEVNATVELILLLVKL